VSPGNRSPSARVIIVADDLTGACDAAVAFSSQGMDTEVVLNRGWAEDRSAEVLAIDTESRDICVEEAVTRLESVARQLDLNRFAHVFKKIDSVFRGNTFDEIAVAAREFSSDLAIMAPAYPALGRTSKDGVVWVRDITGERAVAVRDRLRVVGLNPSHIGVGRTSKEITDALKLSLREGRRFVYCDADSEEDLRAIVRGGRALGIRILWIGSAGLAYALALEMFSDGALLSPSLPRQVPHAPVLGRVVFFVGSYHPVTRRQMVSLREQTHVVEHSFETQLIFNGRSTESLMVEVRCGYTTEADIRSVMERFNKQDVSCLFLTGGDTARLVCRALGITSLQLQDEFEPGLPRGVAVGGAFAGVTVILKSGGFGEADVLCRIAATFQPDFHINTEDVH
jgi:uncharacterized protein YgbK (DUF1537 family)